MRAVILGLAGLVIAGEASAADYLRGSSYESPAPSTSYNWAGIYVGGQVGYASASVEIEPIDRVATSPLLRPTFEPDLTEWPGFERTNARADSYGGFIGYNSQWGEAVVGLELNYNRTSLRATGTQQIVRTTGATVPLGDPPATAIIDHTGEMLITDYGSLRFRAGYAWNWLMPYATVGAAVGRADLMRSAAIRYEPFPPPNAPPYVPYTDVAAKNGAFSFGYSLGAGVDIGLLPGVFVRGEYEFVQLNTINGMTAQLNTVRVAGAVKF
jgi:outer membrane immunogenic protein